MLVEPTLLILLFHDRDSNKPIVLRVCEYRYILKHDIMGIVLGL